MLPEGQTNIELLGLGNFFPHEGKLISAFQQ
jgi:hypothetical protein